ncbi:MAG: biopolymer transporter ExbD [Methanobrevibacter sp.]|nr:biopolymer transporter ExbD [Methanobrevibacter sp.]
MAIDIKRHKEKLTRDEPEIKLVPFIDILFTLLIFLVVTSTFGAATVDDNGSGSGKPNVTDTTGDAEYYLLPVAGLQKVTVNGVDMSSEIKGNAVGVHARVLDQGDVQIKTSEHAIIIKAPPGMSPQEAVHVPE